MTFNARLIIYKKKSVFDDLILVPEKIIGFHKCCQSNKAFSKNTIVDNFNNNNLFHITKLFKKGLNAYLVSAYIFTLDHSDVYRKSAIKKLETFTKLQNVQTDHLNNIILIRLHMPKHQFLDYGWNQRITLMVRQYKEIDHAMSWLSTLGGAFSALGDSSDKYAKVAGQISIEQFKLAIKLGDPQIVARCYLYAALSLLQQGFYKSTKKMVQKIFKFAIQTKDIRLQRMCQGVWAKLKYCYSQMKENSVKSC